MEAALNIGIDGKARFPSLLEGLRGLNPCKRGVSRGDHERRLAVSAERARLQLFHKWDLRKNKKGMGLVTELKRIDWEKPEERIEAHKRICELLTDVYTRKNHDYGDSFHESFVEEGMAMVRIRLGDKFNRLKTLTRLGKGEVQDESIEDTLLDLANYAIMTVMEMERAKK